VGRLVSKAYSMLLSKLLSPFLTVQDYPINASKLRHDATISSITGKCLPIFVVVVNILDFFNFGPWSSFHLY